MFDELERFLLGLQGEQLVYIPNPGNSGDALLAYATYRLFERLSLRYEVGDDRGMYPDRVVVYGGGGNLVEPYQSANQCVLQNLPVSRLLVILPHSVRAYQETLARMGSNCVVFCRERPSFEFVRRHAANATCLLSHDVALSIDVQRLRGEMAQADCLPSPSLNTRVRELKRVLKTAAYRLRNVRSSATLSAFRTDVERTDAPTAGANIDVSHVFALPKLGMTADTSRHMTIQTARFVDRFDTVRTNRLHVGILAAILGKRVELHDNSYGKLWAVYEHSLRDRFANVVWCDP